MVDNFKTIRISKINHNRLLRIKGELQVGTNGMINLDNTISYLLAKENNGGDEKSA